MPEVQNAPISLSFDAGCVLEALGMSLYTFLRNFVYSAIMGPNSGFAQSDGTYALFRYNYEKLQALSIEELSKAPLEIQILCKEGALDLLQDFVEKFLEKK